MGEGGKAEGLEDKSRRGNEQRNRQERAEKEHYKCYEGHAGGSAPIVGAGMRT